MVRAHPIGQVSTCNLIGYHELRGATSESGYAEFGGADEVGEGYGKEGGES